MPEQTANNRYLVDTAWLQDHLDDPDLRILDCTVYLPNYFEESAQEKVEIVPGLQDYKRSHIPGSAFVDLVGDLTDKSNKRFMFPMPSADQFASVMSRLGVGEGTRVVLYDRMVNIWAARVWWMLRAFGSKTPPYSTADGPSGQPRDGQHLPRRQPTRLPTSRLDSSLNELQPEKKSERPLTTSRLVL